MSIKVFDKKLLYSTGGLLMALAIFFTVTTQTAHAETLKSFVFDNYSTGLLDTQDGWDAEADLDIVSGSQCNGGAGKCVEIDSSGTDTGDYYFTTSFTDYDVVTVDADIYLESTVNNSFRFYLQDRVTTDSVCIARAVQTSGTNYYALEGDDLNTATTSSGTLSTDEWIDVTLTYNFTDETCTLLIDNYQLGPTSFDVSSDSSYASTTRFNMGRYGGGNAASRIDNIIFSNEVPESQYVPPATEEYIVITDPYGTPHANVAYTDTVTVQYNNLTSSSSSFIINLVSQTGELYSSLEASSTGITPDTYTFNVSFTKDDIVFARASLYDGDNFDTLLDISEEYEWWISANANPLQPIDLGVFRTGTTTFCGESAGALDFAWGTCMAMRLLFVPNESSITYITDQLSTATQTAPFSYMYDVNTYMDTLFTPATTSWSISVASSTYITDVTLLDSTEVDSNSNFQTIRTFMGLVLLIGMPLYTYRRIKSIGRSL
jgi:hypothetical protein